MRGLLSRPLLRRRGHFLVQWHEFDRWRVIYCTHLISRSRWWRPGEGQRFLTFLLCLELLSFRGANVNMARLDYWKPGVSVTSEV